MTCARGGSPVHHRPSRGSQSVADRRRRASVGSAPVHRRRRACAAPFTESPVQDHLDRVLACECPLHVLVQRRLRSRDYQQVTRCGLGLRQRSHLSPPRREVRSQDQFRQAFAQAGPVRSGFPLPESGQARPTFRCRRPDTCSRPARSTPRSPGTARRGGAGSAGAGGVSERRCSHTRHCAVSALEASSSVPLSCLRRPLGRTIGLNQPGAGTITLSKPLRKSRVADMILRQPAGGRTGIYSTRPLSLGSR